MAWLHSSASTLASFQPVCHGQCAAEKLSAPWYQGHLFNRSGSDSPMMPSRLVLLAAALVLAGCQTDTPPGPEVLPTFYADLASPGAAVDERKAVEMISGYRARFGIAPLRLDPELSRIATQYARQMADADRMSHALTKELRLGDRLKRNGYQFIAAGENIAAGYRTLAEAFSGWRDSPSHDRGMKDAEMTVMGIGTAYNPNSKYKVFWCLILALPRTDVEGVPGVDGLPTVLAVPPN
jgi:uncharacterized protein YkwD